jgi:hypothetical protein
VIICKQRAKKKRGFYAVRGKRGGGNADVPAKEKLQPDEKKQNEKQGERDQ